MIRGTLQYDSQIGRKLKIPFEILNILFYSAYSYPALIRAATRQGVLRVRQPVGLQGDGGRYGAGLRGRDSRPVPGRFALGQRCLTFFLMIFERP